MAAALDAKGTYTASTTGASYTNTSFTVGSGANRALIVDLYCEVTNPVTPTLTWDNGGTNQAMTLIGSAIDTRNVCAHYLFGLVAPTSGAKTLSVGGLDSTTQSLLAYISFTGAKQNGGATTFPNFTSNIVGSGLTLTLNVTTAATDAVVACFGSNGGGESVNQTAWASGGRTTQDHDNAIANLAIGAASPVAMTLTQSTGICFGLATDIAAAAVTDLNNFWFRLWPDPVNPKTKFTPDQQPLAYTFSPATFPGTGATVAGADIAGPTFTRTFIYQTTTRPVVFTVVATPTGWNDPLEQPVRNWRRSIVYTAPFLALGVPPAQVWFPPNVTPDIVPSRAKPVVDFIPWTFLEPAPQVWFPPNITPDFAPAARRPINYLAWAFLEPPPQVWYPPDIYSDIVPVRKKPAADFIPWTFLEPAPQVWFPYDRWPDAAPAAKRVAQNPDWSYGTFITPTFIPTYTQWTQWPDFATRAKPVVDFIPWAFLEPAPQVFFPYAPWDDFTRRKPQYPDTQPLAWTGQNIAAPVPAMGWINWPDFAPKKPVPLNFDSLTLVQLAPQVWFPPNVTPDFASKKPQPLDTQPLAYGYFLPAPTFFLVPDRWPDFATKKKPPLNYDPLAFLQTVRSPFNSFVNWPDFATKKKPPLNYDPLAFLQTVRTPWVTMTTWPDFAPIRGKIGLHPAQQQFTARFAGTISATTVTITMSAFEVNTDGAAAAILVVQSQPAVDAAVSIQEIGILGGSVTP